MQIPSGSKGTSIQASLQNNNDAKSGTLNSREENWGK